MIYNSSILLYSLLRISFLLIFFRFLLFSYCFILSNFYFLIFCCKLYYFQVMGAFSVIIKHFKLVYFKTYQDLILFDLFCLDLMIYLEGFLIILMISKHLPFFEFIFVFILIFILFSLFYKTHEFLVDLKLINIILLLFSIRLYFCQELPLISAQIMVF